MLAQVRLAWWRDRLAESGRDIPAADPLLAALAAHWGARTSLLRCLIDGWEQMLGEKPLSSVAIGEFADGRGRALAAFAELAGAAGDGEAAHAAGRAWAFADLAWRTTDPREREGALASGRKVPRARIRSRELRGVAVLAGLSARALEREEPLMQGRGAAIAAIRLGMMGR